MDHTQGLVAFWPLKNDTRDVVSPQRQVKAEGVRVESGSACFDGRSAFLEVPDSRDLRFATEDFTVALWMFTENSLVDYLGTLVSKFSTENRRGFNLAMLTCSGVTSHQPNYRHLHFGVDGSGPCRWTDRGRPGNAKWIASLAVYEGDLYAGTWEWESHEMGHVYRYAGGDEWIDCGAPDRSNTVHTLSVYQGKLYAGVTRYSGEGSSLPESPNDHPGGKIYRYEGGTHWVFCGALPGADSVKSLTVFGDDLFAIPAFSRGLFRYDGGETWIDCGNPGRRLMALIAYNGHLYAAGNEGHGYGGVFRYDGGTKWSECGFQPGMDQIYSLMTYRGDLYIGAWPEARVFRYDGGKQWSDCGRMGEEKEVMPMMVYNGSLYAGTLPSGEVYRYQGTREWERIGLIDATPNVRYRRAWSMAIAQGELFCGTLPSGKVWSMEVGDNVTYDKEIGPGWRHVVASRRGTDLTLYVDGKEVVRRRGEGNVNVDSAAPLHIGFGASDFFHGRMADIRLYNRSVEPNSVAELYRAGRETERFRLKAN